MKRRICFVLLTAVFALFMTGTSATADVSPWFVEEIENSEAVLAPGTTTYCNKDFMVENMSDETAEVQIILGNGANYVNDRLAPKAMKNYSLGADYGFSGGWESALNTRIDDARIINSTGGTSDLKVICK